MNVNPFQLIQLVKGGMNPQQLVMSLLQNNNNPILQNAVNLAQSGNMTALENLARNLAQQRGLNYDEQLAKLKNSLR